MKPLLIAESANPTFVSVPLEGWSHSTALQQLTGGHIVTQVRNREAFISHGLEEGKDFTAIDSEKIAARLYAINLKLRRIGLGWTTTTALSTLAYYYFENLVAEQFRDRVRSGEFDLIHRITPLSPTASSPALSKLCAQHNIPFVLGPLNGGVPWPKGYDHVRRQEGEWLSYIRPVYKIMPGARKTLTSASAIITGSYATRAQINKKHHTKCAYIAENAVDPHRFNIESSPRENEILEAAFVGRLVPYKGAENLIRAAIPFAKAKQIRVHIFGDGPQKQKLVNLIEAENLNEQVLLHGWVNHKDLQQHLRKCDIFAFPSIREFGGAVVLEAMACGTVPVIADYAGPSELVDERTGFKVPLGKPEELVKSYQQVFQSILDNPAKLEPMRAACVERVRKHFTWEAKALKVLEVYRWALGERDTNPEEDPEFLSHKADS